MFSVSSSRRQIVMLWAIFAAVGCRKADEIRSYSVPKEAAAPRIAATEPGEPSDRMLAAIVPEGDQAWFYKVVGPIAAVSEQEKAVLDFVAAIPPAAGASLPAWKLPDGWTQQAGDGIRLATIRIPSGGKPLELTVTTLSWRKTQDELLRNVNRWRGQMTLPLTSPGELSKDTREMKAGERTITVVDLRGRSGGAGMMGPFAGGGPLSGDASRGGNPLGELPAGHPTVGGNESVPVEGPRTLPVEAAADDPKLEVPDSWKLLPPSDFRRFGFQIADGPRTAAVTVSDFGANSAPWISDLLQNVNRWRGEVQMERITADELDKTIERIEIDGRPATYVALIPDARESEPPPTKATLGAMITVGDRIWYFKMHGSRELVAARQDEFKMFLKSVRFAK